MSKLVVEVCRVEKIEDHPNANRMKLATIKGWKTCVRHDPETGWTQFKPGDFCVYFPPDAILPPALANDRLGIMKYLKELPKNELGERTPGGRVAATNLRGYPSYGVIMKIDPKWGDDPNWPVGTDLAEHFGVTKYEPPLDCTDGDAEKQCPRFYDYTSIEHYGNFPAAFDAGEEIILTEKVHGKNCRMGLCLDTDENCVPGWVYMCGSHDVRRKEWSPQNRRFQAAELMESMIVSEKAPPLGTIFLYNGSWWKVEECYERPVKSILLDAEGKRYFGPEEIRAYIKTARCTQEGETILRKSEFWEFLNDGVKGLLEYMRDEYPWDGNKFSIILYGELYGSGVQDMTYGMRTKGFRAFDLALNNLYLDFAVKVDLFKRFGIEMVPILYQGPFSQEVVEKHTSGPTTLCEPSAIKSGFKGREGVVILPTKERLSPVIGKRCCLKSVSTDYLARSGGTDFH